MCAMWKPTQPLSIPLQPAPEPVRPVPAAPPAEPVAHTVRTMNTHGDASEIGKGLIFKGEITGSESLYVNGRVEGSINLPGSRVTIGPDGQVHAHMSVCINAREIVVMGRIHGNVSATDRVDLRAEGTLVGDVSAARISIEDGAYFKGGIDLRKAAEKPEALARPQTFEPEISVTPETPGSLLQQDL